MGHSFQFTLEDKWPPLAWVAKCTISDPVIHVRHGPQLEVRGAWFCEAVWDGDFTSGDFDQTDLVFGSGARLRNGRVVFVSSGSTIDRLQFLELDERVWISNSLACLLAVSRARVDVTYEHFPDFFMSIVQGIDAYERRLPTLTGRLELAYFRNLVWDGQQLVEEEKPLPGRDFGSFEKYRRFLEASLAEIASNMQAADRNHRYEMVSGLSSGYDSTTATILAQGVGMERAFSFHTARGGEKDHGEEMARILGLELTLLNRRDWRHQAYAELPYFAATGLGTDVVFSSAQKILRGRVLVSGFHGDKVWAKDTKALEPDIVRGDASGLSFTEHRLHLGCIHLPMPFMGVRQIRDVNILSNSAELTSWDITGDYSRPICRRIVEEAGIPRELFGMKKKAATNLFQQGEAVLTEQTRVAYHHWLRSNKYQWAHSGVNYPKVPSSIILALHMRYYHVNRLLRALARFLPAKASAWIIRMDVKLQRWLNRRINLVPHLFPWAIERMADVYIPAKNDSNQ